MFSLRNVTKTLPSRNVFTGSYLLDKTVRRSFASQSGVSRSIDRHGTTILVVRKDGKTVMAGDGQVSAGSSVVKGNAKKVRRLGDNILVGFAGSTADALTLLERLEKKLEEHPGQLTRACVELAKAWRSDKYLRRLEAVLLVADDTNIFELTGNGDVLEPEHGVMGVGSGGSYAQAAALALVDQPGVGAEEIVRRAMKIAGDICVYTNHNVLLEIIDPVAIALAKKEKAEKEALEKLNEGKVKVEVVKVEGVDAATPPLPPHDVVPTGY